MDRIGEMRVIAMYMSGFENRRVETEGKLLGV